MRISLLGFFLALSLPAVAAEPNQDLKQAIAKVASAYTENFNNKDAAGITSLFTKNYLRVTAEGVVPDNTKLYEGVFRTGFDHLEVKTTEIQPLSDDMAMATGVSRITGKSEKGDPLDVTIIWTDVLVRENGQWKIRMLTSLPKTTPVTTPQQAAK